ncbi:YdcF family protein, partial [bacterium]|nr:YdcF family protein [bacterium]
MKYDTLFVLGGGLKKNPDGTWRTTYFDEEGDEYGSTGDYLRVKAAATLFKKGFARLIIVSGSKGQLHIVSNAPTVASVLKKELVREGVPSDAIAEDHDSGTTYEQLKKITGQKKEGRVGIISNRYHLPRIRAMIEHAPELSELKDAKLISAEETLLES